MSAALHVAYYPNVEAIIQRLAQNNESLKQQLFDYSKQCIQPAYDYYTRHIQGCLDVPLAAFKAARVFDPKKIQPTAITIDSLSVFPFLSSVSTLNALKGELAQYISLTEDLSSDFDPLRWWKLNKSVLPTWASCAQEVLCIQPSSAAAERISRS